MIGLILAGGYGMRLRPLTERVPKPLLEIGGKALVDHIVERLLEVDEVERILVVTNERFRGAFEGWLAERRYGGVEVVVEPGRSNEEKLGAIGGLARLLGEEVGEEYLVIAGDNLFTSGLRDLVAYYRERGAAVVALYDIGDLDLVRQLSAAELGPGGRILRFEEKPEKPFSTLVGTGIYALPPRSLRRIREYLEEGNNPDSPGYFIQWLHRREPVYGYVLKGRWWDIGTPETYLEAKAFFERK